MKFSSVKREARGAHRRRARMIPIGIVAAAGVLGGSLAVFNSQDNATAGEAFPRASHTATPGATPSDQPSSPAPTASKAGNSKVDRYEAEIHRLVNKTRVEHGCAPLHRDPRLDKAARLHSQDMAAHSHYSHTSTDGKGPKERMEAQGYDDASGENIDAWPTTPQGAFDAWMHSPEHRDQILACHSKGTGIGVALGGKHRAYWTQDFGYK
ncbi:CAP domain-containing protein [Streptomyces tubercidicus]|uniref:CAP domain-containing protein n=1 Tax=Streptomyces tubercidicus TaxID=47759 RepID=UPI001359F862|nr:CAP domain-containing protein [Streptomyces tubercidicus]WAU10320.1 CAP domain-containing protein [Streptomyces tubercidicus]